MSESHVLPFSLGLTYWPRRSGFGWWSAFDRAEARDELAHVAALGCNTVRFCLRWEDFQPGPQRLNSRAMRALEQALDAAREAGLRVTAALFPVALGGALHIPSWANAASTLDDLRRAAQFGPELTVRPAGPPTLLYDGAYRANQARDSFTTQALIDAQRYLVREVAGYFGPHPALWAWQLGEGLERVHRPASAEAVSEWYAALAEALREQHPAAQLLGLTSARSLAQRAGPRPEHLAAACDLVGVAVDPPAPRLDRQPTHVAYVAYLRALTATLARQPAIVAGIGLATAPDGRAAWVNDSAYGRAVRTYLGDLDQQAAFVAAALERLFQDGARGAWLAAYADYSPRLWERPPLDRTMRERTLGLVDAEGREKPAAAAVRAFAHALAEARPPAGAPFALDPERYWRDPERAFKALWREYSAE